MDRNSTIHGRARADDVALRKESVDRNTVSGSQCRPLTRSLSARRAWIEILDTYSLRPVHHASLSARRAWIEIDTLL